MQSLLYTVSDNLNLRWRPPIPDRSATSRATRPITKSQAPPSRSLKQGGRLKCPPAPTNINRQCPYQGLEPEAANLCLRRCATRKW